MSFIVIGLFYLSISYGYVILVYVFQRSDPFHLICWIYVQNCTIPSYPLDTCEAYIHITSFIPDKSNLCLVFFFLSVLIEICQFYQSFQKNIFFIDFLYCFSILNLIDIYFNLYYFLPSAFLGFILLFIFPQVLQEA